jgi:chemotaxis protein methyltransferase CheR
LRFRFFNLLDSMPILSTFDVVFCRKVLIYFDQATKSAVLVRINTQMASDGYLYLRRAETVLGVSDRLKPGPGQ